MINIRIGTRASQLALAQTKLVAELIRSVRPDVEIEMVKIKTRGDRILDRPLADIGGKGLFVEEIERAILSGDIDIAVHSGKDMPPEAAEGLSILAVPKAGDRRDALISMKDRKFDVYGHFTVGTGSPRRRAEIMRMYPNAEVLPLRGNVNTRLRRLEEGSFDAVVLAAAGLSRLNLPLEACDVKYFSPREFIPSPAQGILAVEGRRDGKAAAIVRLIEDRNSRLCFEAERRVAAELGADCHDALGAYCQISGQRVYIAAFYGAKRAEAEAGINGIDYAVIKTVEGLR